VTKEKKPDKQPWSPKPIGDLIVKSENYQIKTDIRNDDIYLYNDGYYKRDGVEAKLETIIDRQLGLIVNINRIREVLEYIKRHTREDLTATANSNYICLNNGLLNLSTLEKELHNPKYFVKHKLNVDFNPDVDDTIWNWYIESILPEKEKQHTLQECCGNVFEINAYTLKKLVWLVGRGDSGKSTFLNIFSKFLGVDNISSVPIYHLASTHENIDLAYSIANIGSEIPSDIKIKNTEIVKVYTGSDAMLQFNPKFKPTFKVKPVSKLFYASNSLPPVDKRADDVFYKRIAVVEFEQGPFPKDDMFVSKYTTPEMKSTILNWMVEGYKRLRKNHWKLTYEKSVEEVKELFEHGKLTTSLIYNWYISCCKVCMNPEIWYSTDNVYENYKRYCKKPPETNPLTKNVFCRLMYQMPGVVPYQPTVDGKQIPAVRGLELIL
jgi:putative DNA primase/helicase